MVKFNENDLKSINGGRYYLTQNVWGVAVCVAVNGDSEKYLLPGILAFELLHSANALDYYRNLSRKDSMDKYGVNEIILNKMVDAFNS